MLYIVPALLAVGVRMLNPVQPKAHGMDPQCLKKAYGQETVFHEDLDTQEALTSNCRQTNMDAVHKLRRTMNPADGGGHLFSPAHNLQHEVSPESIVCMHDAAVGRT